MMLLNWYKSKISDSAEESNDVDSSSSCTDTKFKFPPPPCLCKSASPSSVNYRSASDSSISDTNRLSKTKRRNKRKYIKALPPIGVFWDIENCQVPKTKSAALVVQQIRELFYNDYREAEFLVVCDVKKESSQIVTDLNDAQVNLIHVSSISKNAADEKLRQSLRRFSELHKTPAAVALISGDVNFAADLSDLRYRKKIHVILLHNNNVADALILCANETYNFTSITERIPSASKFKSITNQQIDLLVFNLPLISNNDVGRLKNRLKYLSDNCGGRVLSIHKDSGYAVIRFTSLDFAKRAQKRLEGEYVFGHKIQVSQPNGNRELMKNCSGRKVRTEDVCQQATIHETNNQYFKNSSWTPSNFDGNGYIGNPQSLFTPIKEIGLANHSVDEYNSAFDKKNHLTNSRHGETREKGIELIVSNLDSSIDSKELYNILLSKLKQYVMVLNISINPQSGGPPIGIIKVGTQQEAQLVISHLHHQRLGGKRITVSYTQTKSDGDQLRFIIIALLQEAPSNSMPLFKFFELAESRYHVSISLSEVNKLRDICKVTESQGGRMISLTSKAHTSLPVQMESVSLYLYCAYHCPNGLENSGWGEALDFSLPNIKISLKIFESQVNKLLTSHLGCLPLLSFPVCYAVEFGPLPESEFGVPLEHLLTCIPNLVLTCSDQNKNIKYLELKNMEDSHANEDILVKSVSPSLMTNISMFCREVVDLLKTVDNCQLLMRRYIPTYHHHFGRQCRVADYGFTRLVDLFEAISHIVQILGYGAKRIITLTHSAQVRRFTSDLLRVLKGQVSKRVAISNFTLAYEKTFRKAFNPVEYGLCTLEDLLSQVPEGTVVITQVDIAIPKREQTADEVRRTKEFALEVKQLLSHSPYCAMLFNKFVPAYHHHFGRQCKVSEYGFTKLVELFEAIAHTVDLEGSSDVDRKVKLKLPLALDVLGDQIQTLVKESNHPAVFIEDVFSQFTHRYGYNLKPEAYECKDFMELAFKLNNFIRIVHGSAGTLLTVSDVDMKTLEIRVWSLLLNPPHTCSIRKFIFDYRVRFLGTLPITKLEQLKTVIVMTNNGTETILFLTPLYILAARLYHLLFVNGGCILLCDIPNIYLKKFGIPLSPCDYGMSSFEDLLWQMSFAVTLKGSGKQLSIVLNKDLAEYGIELPSAVVKDHYFKCQESFNWPPPVTNLSYKNFYSFSSLKCDSPIQSGGNFFYTNNDLGTKLGLTVESEGITPNPIYSYSDSLNAVIPKISSPHPTDLPTPVKLMSQADDSGLNNSRYECTNSEICLSDHQQTSLMKMDIISNIVEKSLRDSQKSITVTKNLDLEYDLGTLVAFDPNILDSGSLKNNKDEYLLKLSRDNIQLLFNKIWELPTQQIDESLVVKLPPARFILPRARPVPKPRPLTKWQEFAKLKGIKKTKKAKLSWDEQLQKWIPFYGYKRVAAERERDWVLEVPATADPMEDQFLKRKTGRSEKVAKNELQRLRNIAKTQKIKIPRTGVTHPDVSSSKDLQTAITVARSATASLGKFQDKLAKEKDARGVNELIPGLSRKRKLPAVSNERERHQNLEILESVLNKRCKLNIEKAVARKIRNKPVEKSEGQPKPQPGKRMSKSNSRKNGKKSTSNNKKVQKKGGGGRKRR
ncbi:hypothetical protein FQR65_LT14275 [Abscondita terminalis]|nr:hypothetical protein FQR65_LT14275 [Abscondita terminalis]